MRRNYSSPAIHAAGMGRALDMILTGRPVDAAEALRPATSAFLRANADSPVDWQRWEASVLGRAQAEGRHGARRDDLVAPSQLHGEPVEVPPLQTLEQDGPGFLATLVREFDEGASPEEA